MPTDVDDQARVDVGLSPQQLLARIRVLYPRLRNDRDHLRGRRSADDALVAEIRALADRYRVLTADRRAVA